MLNLLPVPSRKSVGNHVLLAEPLAFPEITDPAAKGLKELLLISHDSSCRVRRAKTPRAD